MHSIPFTTSPTSFGKYANFSIISFQFSFALSRSIAFHFFGCTLHGKWLIHSVAEGAYSQPKEGATGHTNAYGIIAPLHNVHLHIVDKGEGPHCPNASR